MAIAGQGIPATTATAAPASGDEAAKAAASVFEAGTSGTPIAGAGESSATPESDPGPNRSGLNASVLGNQTIPIGGVDVPIGEFIDFGQAGAMLSESSAASAYDTHAIAGVAGADGAVTLDTAEGGFSTAEIDLLALFKRAGLSSLTGQLVDQATLRLGIGGAEVTTANGEFLDPDGVGGAGQYRVGEVSVLLHSPQMEDASAQLYDAIGLIDDAAEEKANEMLAQSTLTEGFPSGTSVTAVVTSQMQEQIFAAILAQEVTSKNELLSVDFSTGVATLHLDKLLSGKLRPGDPTGLNAQNPNTELVDDELYPMIAETVHDLMEEVTTIALGAVEGALDSITVTFTATSTPSPEDSATATWSVNLNGDQVEPVECTGTGPQGAAACEALTGSVAAAPVIKQTVLPVRDFLVGDGGKELFDLAVRDVKTQGITVPVRSALEPTIETLATVFSIQLNRQKVNSCTMPDGTKRQDALKVSAISVALLRASNLAVLDFGNAGTRVDSCAPTADASIFETTLGLTRLADAGYSWADPNGNPGPNSGGLNASALGNRVINLDDQEVPLSDFIDFGEAGLMLSESTATTPYDAHAISGVAGNDGSISFDDQDGGFAPVTLDLLALFQQGGSEATDLLVDKATLELGIGGAEVTAVDGNFLDPDGVGGPGRYRVGEASLLMHSPAIDEASAQLYDAIGLMDDTAEEQVNKLLDLTALTESLPLGTGITAQVRSQMQEQIFEAILAQEITTKNEVLSVNFATGDFTLHLDKALHGEELVDGPLLEGETVRPGDPDGLNAQHPNTELIDDELYPMIAETIHDLMEEVTAVALGAVEGALASITVDFTATSNPSAGQSAVVTWSVNLMGTQISKPTCTSQGLLGVLTCTTLQLAVNLAAPIVKTALVPVRNLLVSDAGHQVFALAVDDVKTGALTIPVRKIVEPVVEKFAEVFSIQLNHQQRGTCLMPDGTRRLSSLKVSAVSVALVRPRGVARANFGNAAVRTPCNRP